MNKIKQKLNKLKNKTSQYLAEIFIVIGLVFLIYTTLIINVLAGLYLIGVVVIILGLIIAKGR